MFNRVLYVIFLILLYQHSFSQDLDFHSNLEKELFDLYVKDSTKIDFFKALHLIDSTSSLEKINYSKLEIDKFIKTLPLKEDKEKKEEKRIRKIFDLVHRRFFNQYSIDAYFPDIFKNGTYNCVTATALYGYIFQQINIPFIVKESPAHVYLIAYPQTSNIYLETTVPGGLAFKEFEISQIKKTVNALVESKLINQDSINIKGYEKTFYDYFYNNDDMPLQGLIGVQYYNKGIFNFNQHNYKDAEINLRKSLLFYKPNITNYLIKEIIKHNLIKLDYNSVEDIEYIVRALNQMKLNEDYDLIQAKGLIYNFVIEDETSQEIILKGTEKLEKITDSVVRKEALEVCYGYLAERNSNLGNPDRALSFVERLAEVNPKNKYIETIVSFNVSQKIGFMTFSKSSIDTIQKYINKYPFLEKNARIVSSKYIMLLRNTHDLFRANKAEDGEKLRAQMETFYEEKKDLIQVSPELPAETYRAIGSYYYGRKKYALAINMYKKGLMFSPEHVELNKLLKWAKEDQ